MIKSSFAIPLALTERAFTPSAKRCCASFAMASVSAPLEPKRARTRPLLKPDRWPIAIIDTFEPCSKVPDQGEAKSASYRGAVDGDHNRFLRSHAASPPACRADSPPAGPDPPKPQRG